MSEADGRRTTSLNRRHTDLGLESCPRPVVDSDFYSTVGVRFTIRYRLSGERRKVVLVPTRTHRRKTWTVGDTPQEKRYGTKSMFSTTCPFCYNLMAPTKPLQDWTLLHNQEYVLPFLPVGKEYNRIICIRYFRRSRLTPLLHGPSGESTVGINYHNIRSSGITSSQ